MTPEELHILFTQARGKKAPLLLDGALGTMLQSSGIQPDPALWFTPANETHPEVVLRLHTEYHKAGADIITANTFRTNPAAFQKAGGKWNPSYAAKAVHSAIEAAQEKQGTLVAGSNAPAEDCYQKEITLSFHKISENHRLHIDALVNSGVDFILAETHSHRDEILYIAEYCFRNRIPYILSFYTADDLTLLSGESLFCVWNEVLEFHPAALGVNCIQPALFERFLSLAHPAGLLKSNWFFYLNCGEGSVTDASIQCGVPPSEYTEIVKRSLRYRPSMLGACCGSSPRHTKNISQFFKDVL